MSLKLRKRGALFNALPSGPVDEILPLLNAGFESGDLSNWEILQNSWAITSTRAKSGTYSVRITGTGTSTFYFRSDAIDVSAHAAKIDAGLLFTDTSSWVYNQSNGNNLRHRVEFFDGAMVALGVGAWPIYTGVNVWYNFTTLAEAVPVGTRNIKMRLRADKVTISPIAHFDDCSIRLYE